MVDDPAFDKYRVTCHMEVSDYKRWCHDCPNSTQAFIHHLAMGWDPFRMGFEVFMLSEDKQTLYSLFKKPVHDSDDYHSFIREEEALAFSLSRWNNFLLIEIAGLCLNGPIFQTFSAFAKVPPGC